MNSYLPGPNTPNLIRRSQMMTQPRKIKANGVVWVGLSLVALLIMFAPLPIAAAPVERTVHIQAHSYEYFPSVIRVNTGDRVTLEFASNDVVHGLYLDGYDLALTADPGQTARLTFVADRTGTFRLRCSVTCGPLHPFMIGKLMIGSNELGWRAVGLVLLATVAGLWTFR